RPRPLLKHDRLAAITGLETRGVPSRCSQLLGASPASGAPRATVAWTREDFEPRYGTAPTASCTPRRRTRTRAAQTVGPPASVSRLASGQGARMGPRA